MKISLSLCLLSLTALLLTGCGTTQKVPQSVSYTIPLELKQLPPSNKYINFDYGIRLNVLDKRANTAILNRYDAAPGMPKLSLNTYPDVKSFVSESCRQYMQTMGFVLDADIDTDYMMQIEITQFQVSLLSGMGWIGTESLDIQIFDENRAQVYPRTTVTGRSSSNSSNTYREIQNTLSNISTGKTDTSLNRAINSAYISALENIDWNRIAYFLKRADTPAGEKNKQVDGSGETALEHTIIRWFVDSSPRGADVEWRVVSSTPDVKNTNQTWLGSTPYESTESFDIRGLTFNNSGDVQIEISCSKPGYITQKRRFNLRQAIEQKEISTKFNLVKEDAAE